jgi:hypothetical protein
MARFKQLLAYVLVFGLTLGPVVYLVALALGWSLIASIAAGVFGTCWLALAIIVGLDF